MTIASGARNETAARRLDRAVDLLLAQGHAIAEPSLRPLIEAAAAIRAAGYDVCSHGWRWVKHFELSEAEERERNFLMTVSHELRTPLTAIRGHTEALAEGLADDPDARAASLEVIRAEADRLARLVGDLLDLAKLDAHRFTLAEDEVEVRRLLERAYQSRSEEARRRRIAYERSFEADPVLCTDGDRVLQIVSNLLDNAFTWTPDGGRIALGLSTANGTVSVSVADTGPGIGPEEQERIFRPFYSRNGAGGVGLGLAIARELAHALGGDLSLESERGRGARFQLTLPAR